MSLATHCIPYDAECSLCNGSASAASLPAVPANLKEAIAAFEVAVANNQSAPNTDVRSTLFDRVLASRSNLENLFFANPPASPDQDFLKLLDELWYGQLESTPATWDDNGKPTWDWKSWQKSERYLTARRSLVDYLEGIRADRDAARSQVKWLHSENERHRLECEMYEQAESELSVLKESALTKQEATEVIEWLPVDATYLDSHPVIESARTKIFRVARRISSSNKE